LHLFAIVVTGSWSSDLHLFAVFDGHGACGAACAGFAWDVLPRLLAGGDSGLLPADPAAALREAMLAANAEIHATVGVDNSTSGQFHELV
jgi:serine/threonine protein phosphatase PrpC